MGQFETDLTTIIDEVQRLRFTAQSSISIERWVFAAYAEMWHAADWPWKFTEIPLTVTADSDEAVLGAGGDVDPQNSYGQYNTAAVNRVVDVWDADGVRLTYVRPREYNAMFLGSTDTGAPSVWTDKWESDNVASPFTVTIVSLGPIPSESATFTARVELQPPNPDPDDRSPSIPAEWQYALTYGAMAIGLRLENDPTWSSVRQMFLEAIMSLANAKLPSSLNENRSYGGPDNITYGVW